MREDETRGGVGVGELGDDRGVEEEREERNIYFNILYVSIEMVVFLSLSLPPSSFSAFLGHLFKKMVIFIIL